MIYLEQTTEAQRAFIPANGKGTPARLRLTGTVGLEMVMDTEVVDMPLSSFYYSVAFSLPDGTPSGEYDYVLEDADGLELSRGLAMVCGPSRGDTQYEEKITFKQYGED